MWKVLKALIIAITITLTFLGVIALIVWASVDHIRLVLGILVLILFVSLAISIYMDLPE